MSVAEKIKNAIKPQQGIDTGNKVYTERQFHKKGMELEIDEEVRKQLQEPISTGLRFLFYEPTCDVCPMWEDAVDEMNDKLYPRYRIAKVKVHPQFPGMDSRVKMIQPTGTPELYLDGVRVKGATSRLGQKGFLKGFLGDCMTKRRVNDREPLV